jgi:3-hydroxyisobutyrate dehydrogenase
LSNLAPRILKKDYQPGFLVDHFVKDMGIVLEEAKAMRLALPGLALAHQLYVALQAHDGGKLGTQGLILALAQLSNMNLDQ